MEGNDFIILEKNVDLREKPEASSGRQYSIFSDAHKLSYHEILDGFRVGVSVEVNSCKPSPEPRVEEVVRILCQVGHQAEAVRPVAEQKSVQQELSRNVMGLRTDC